MKIDRLIGIIITLLSNEKVTMPYLAEKFEVSRRTINRDIEDLCKAGIPIVSTQGFAGGIAIEDGYKINKALLKKQELEIILTGLKGLESILERNDIDRIKEKFSEKNREVVSSQGSILIDLSSHYKNEIKEKIELLKYAVDENLLIKFKYYYNKGEVYKTVEPYFIIFQWGAWYVFSYSSEKKDFRLFKLNRMTNLEILEEYFEKREIPKEKLELNKNFTDEIILKAVFHNDVKYRLIEEYGPKCFKETEDGKLLFEFGFTNKDYLLSWILSFGDTVWVLEPDELKEELKKNAENMIKKYK